MIKINCKECGKEFECENKMSPAYQKQLCILCFTGVKKGFYDYKIKLFKLIKDTNIVGELVKDLDELENKVDSMEHIIMGRDEEPKARLPRMRLSNIQQYDGEEDFEEIEDFEDEPDKFIVCSEPELLKEKLLEDFIRKQKEELNRKETQKSRIKLKNYLDRTKDECDKIFFDDEKELLKDFITKQKEELCKKETLKSKQKQKEDLEKTKEYCDCIVCKKLRGDDSNSNQ